MPQELLLVVGILFKTVPLLVAGTAGVMLFSRSTLGKAVIHRLQDEGGDAETVAALQADVDELRRELGDVQERLDFAERRLLRQHAAPRPTHPDNPSPPEPMPAARG